MKKVIGLLMTAACSLALADTTAMRISSDAVSFKFEPVPSATNSMQLGFLYNDDYDTFLLSAGLFANGQRDRFSGRLGAKAYYADLDDDAGPGMALGGDFSFAIRPDLSVNAGLFYGPDSLSFAEIEGYEEWFVRLHYQVFETAQLGVGYGSLEMEPEDKKDFELDEGLFFEMILQF